MTDGWTPGSRMDEAPGEATRAGTSHAMMELVRSMARALVDQPDQVTIESKSDGDGTVLMLRVAPADLGKVIGKQGRTARSIRTILGAASMKAQHRFALDIEQVGRVLGSGAESGTT